MDEFRHRYANLIFIGMLNIGMVALMRSTIKCNALIINMVLLKHSHQFSHFVILI